MKDYVLNRGDLTDAAATEYNSKPWSKACREKSAEVIVPATDSSREGLNPTEVYNQERLLHESKNAENADTERQLPTAE